jgi:hypothetical protein
MHWSESGWFKEWLSLARRNYQMFKSDFGYHIEPSDKPNNFGKETCEAQDLSRKQADD